SPSSVLSEAVGCAGTLRPVSFSSQRLLERRKRAAAQQGVAADEAAGRASRSLWPSPLNTGTLCGCSLPARAECRRYFSTGSACRKQPLHQQIERYTWIACLHFCYSRLA